MFCVWLVWQAAKQLHEENAEMFGMKKKGATIYAVSTYQSSYHHSYYYHYCCCCTSYSHLLTTTDHQEGLTV